jgi:hypothetical protein
MVALTYEGCNSISFLSSSFLLLRCAFTFFSLPS